MQLCWTKSYESMQKSNFVTGKDCVSSNLACEADYRNGLINRCTQTNFNSYVNLHFTPPKKTHIVKELCTQTSKTLIPSSTPIGSSSPDIVFNHNKTRRSDRFCNGDYQKHKSKERVRRHNALYCDKEKEEVDSEDESLISPKALALIPFDRSFNVVNFFRQSQRSSREQNKLLSGTVLTQTYLEKNRNKLKNNQIVKNSEKPFFINDVNKQSESKFEIIHNKSERDTKINQITQTDKKARSLSFMSPTIASQGKNQSLEIKSIEKLISPSRRARSISPRLHHKMTKSRTSSSVNVPFIDKSDATLPSGHKIQTYNDLDSKGEYSTSSTETALFQAMWKLRDPDWSTSLRGLADIIELCEYLGSESIQPHMTIINQRLTELIKSPRSHVSRSSCQAVGHIFKYIKDTRGPEFNELVDTLLCKCADSSKFIRHDANSALDCMVIHIPTFHAVRALCAKGTEHKNPLVRTATARLLVCATILAQPQNILHPQSNEYTRRRIILAMVGFLEDRHSDVRKYGERLYKILSKDRIFDLYLSRYLEREVIFKMRKIIKMS